MDTKKIDKICGDIHNLEREIESLKKRLNEPKAKKKSKLRELGEIISSFLRVRSHKKFTAEEIEEELGIEKKLVHKAVEEDRNRAAGLDSSYEHDIMTVLDSPRKYQNWKGCMMELNEERKKSSKSKVKDKTVKKEEIIQRSIDYLKEKNFAKAKVILSEEFKDENITPQKLGNLYHHNSCFEKHGKVWRLNI